MDQQLEAKGPRMFVGLKIAPNIAQDLAQRARHLERSPSRFVPSEDIHLTLAVERNFHTGRGPETTRHLEQVGALSPLLQTSKLLA